MVGWWMVGWWMVGWWRLWIGVGAVMALCLAAVMAVIDVERRGPDPLALDDPALAPLVTDYGRIDLLQDTVRVVLLPHGKQRLYLRHGLCNLTTCVGWIWRYDPVRGELIPLFRGQWIDLNRVGINRERTFVLYETATLRGGAQSSVMFDTWVNDLQNGNSYQQYGWGWADTQPIPAVAQVDGVVVDGVVADAPQTLACTRLALGAIIVALLGLEWFVTTRQCWFL